MPTAVPKFNQEADALHQKPFRNSPEAVPDRIVTDLSEDGKWETRTVLLTAEHLEVRGPQGERLHRFARHEITGAEAEETGGAAQLEIRLSGGGVHRIAASTLSGIRELRLFADKIGSWTLGTAPAEAEGPLTGEAQESPAAVSWTRRFKVLAGLMKYSLAYRKSIALSGAVLLLCAAMGAAPPYIMKLIIDGGVLTSSESRFIGLIVLLLSVHVLLAACEVLRTSIGIRIGNLIMSRIRKDMFDKLMRLSVKYYDQRKTAPFIGRIQYDTAYVESFLSEAIPNLLVQIFMTAAVVVLLFVLDWRMAGILACLFPVCALLVWRLWPKLRAFTLRTWNAEYGLQQYVAETLQGIRIIKAFRQEDAERHRFGEWNAAAVKRSAEQQRWSQWLHPGLNLAVSGGIGLVWLAGGLQVIRGHTSLGTVIAFTSYLAMFLGQLRWSVRSTGWINKSVASADRILDLLHTPEALTEPEDPVPLPAAKGDIRFQSVSFSYDQGHEVLKDVNLHIRPGEKVGVTGRSGAGKSTLIHLLCRFYDPDAGNITIDGTDLRRVASEDLRTHIGIVFQETFLFDGTIAQNIAYGRPEAAPEEILEAARCANAHGFIAKLPYGYDTRIGERGVRLSGGEKQRISIARTLLQDPAILILDEATSSMDAETEKEIQEALEVLCRGRTTVAVAHRLSTLREADRIIVLDEGRIMEMGTHRELDESRGIYHRLLKANQAVSAAEEAAG